MMRIAASRFLPASPFTNMRVKLPLTNKREKCFVLPWAKCIDMFSCSLSAVVNNYKTALIVCKAQDVNSFIVHFLCNLCHA